MNGARPVSRRSFAAFVAGQFASDFGSQLYDIAMLLWLYKATGSATTMGVAMLLSNLPEAVLSPLGGAVADRFGRVRTMVLADVASTLSVLAVAVVLWSPAVLPVKIAALAVGNVLLGLSAACFSPAASSLLPSLVADRQLDRANAAHRFSTTGARVFGQGCGGMLFFTLGIVGAGLLNAASFAVSALAALLIRVPRSARPAPLGVNVLASVWQAFRELWHTAVLRRVLAGIAVFHFCLASLPVLLPFVTEQRLGLAPSWFGTLAGSYTAGILGGFVLVGVLPAPAQARFRRIGVWSALAGLLFALLGVSRHVAVAVPTLVGIGACIGVIVVNLITELQQRSPEERRGVTMGVAGAVGNSSMPIGMALFGLLFDGLRNAGLSGPTATCVLLLGCGALAVAAGVWIAAGGKRTDAAGAVMAASKAVAEMDAGSGR